VFLRAFASWKPFLVETGLCLHSVFHIPFSLRIAVYNESILTFIGLYKAKPVLWDPTHPKHYNKHTQSDAWAEIAEAVGFWNNLADCLFRNFEKVLQAGVRIARSQNPQCTQCN
jgi:hypothetical protein